MITSSNRTRAATTAATTLMPLVLAGAITCGSGQTQTPAPQPSRTPPRPGPAAQPADAPRLRLQVQAALTTSSRGIQGFQFGPYSPDGRLVLVFGHSPGIWDATIFRELRRFENLGSVVNGAFSPDGRTVILEASGGSAWKVDVATGRADAVPLDRSLFTRANVTPGQAGAGTPGSSGSPAAPRRPPDPYDLYMSLRGKSGGYEMTADVFPLAFSPDGRWIVTGGTWHLKTFRVWDISTGQPSGDSGEIEAESLAIVQGRVVTSARREAQVWNIDSGQPLPAPNVSTLPGDSAPLLAPGQAPIHAHNSVLAYNGEFAPAATNNPREGVRSPDGTLSLTVDAQGRPHVWEMPAGREVRPLEYPSTPLLSRASGGVAPGAWGLSGDLPAFSADGRFAIIVHGDAAEARIWDISTGKVTKALRFRSPDPAEPAQGRPPFFQAINALYGGGDALVLYNKTEGRLYDLATNREVRKFALAGSGPSRGLKFGLMSMSPNGRFLLVAAKDMSAQLFDLRTNEQVATIVQDSKGGWVVAAPDGRFDTNRLGGTVPLHWVDDSESPRVLPLDIFSRAYYTPRLLAHILADRPSPPLPDISKLNRAQPEVTITEVKPHLANEPNLPENLRSADRADVQVAIKATIHGARTSGAHDVRLFRDGRLVAYRSGPVPLDARGQATIAFPGINLPRDASSGRHPVRFSAYAFNSDRVKSETATLEYMAPRSTTPATRRAFIVAIGVNAVPKMPVLTLRFAANDARDLAETLRAAFRRQNFDTIDVTTMISEASQPAAATKAEIRKKLSELAGTVLPGDVVVVSFSGHGVTDAEGQLHIIPSDVIDSGKPLPANSISSSELSEWLEPLDAGEMVLLLDACHSAASVEAGGFRPGPMGDRGLGQLAYDKRIRVLAASQAADVALENERLQKGLLSYALIDRGLRTGAADWFPKDGFIKMGEWLQYGVAQVPVLVDQIRSGELPASPESGQASRDAFRRTPRRNAAQRPALFDFNDDSAADVVIGGQAAPQPRQ